MLVHAPPHEAQDGWLAALLNPQQPATAFETLSSRLAWAVGTAFDTPFRPMAGVSRVGETADFYAPRGDNSRNRKGPPAAPTAVPDLPIAPVRIGPNGTYRSPSKRLIWACLIG